MVEEKVHKVGTAPTFETKLESFGSLALTARVACGSTTLDNVCM